VFVFGADPISTAGAKAALMWQPTVELLGPADIDRARVALVVADAADDSAAKVIRALRREGSDRPRVVMVAARFDEQGVVDATAAGCSAFMRRSQASPAKLVEVIHAVDAAGCLLPEGLLKRAAIGAVETDKSAAGIMAAGTVAAGTLAAGSPGVANGVGDASAACRPAPQSLPDSRRHGDPLAGLGEGDPEVLSDREYEVLRLIAEGLDTAEVAEQLSFSESTIKGVLTKVMVRIGARNRCHAIAIVLRRGLI
jgi:DNA-binding NarL/FixJ family response regulator